MDNEQGAMIADLIERVAKLEANGAKESRTPALPEGVPADANVVSYTGTGEWGGRTLAWQMTRSWEEVSEGANRDVAAVLSALASSQRLEIVAELVSGPAATSELASRLGDSSTGQLFHHLKELMAAGLVHQPKRGTYALRPSHVLPMLAVLSAGADLASADGGDPE